MTAVHAAPSLPEVLDRLDRLTDWEKRPRGGMRVGLAPMRDLLHRLGEPQASLRVIHVAGTKGKGSVCALIEAGLMRAGLRIGRYASPHVESVAERVCLQGRPVESQLGSRRNALLASTRLAAASRQRRDVDDYLERLDGSAGTLRNSAQPAVRRDVV